MKKILLLILFGFMAISSLEARCGGRSFGYGLFGGFVGANLVGGFYDGYGPYYGSFNPDFHASYPYYSVYPYYYNAPYYY